MSRDSSPRTDDRLSRPRPLHLLDSAGQAEALRSLAATRGIPLQTSDPASPAPDNPRAICLQSVPATADAHWFSHVAPHHVPVRFHLPHVAELVITPAQDEARCTAAADALVQLGLQVLLAPARTGLLVDRIRHACLNEALALLGEGVPAEQVEKAGVDAGLVSGPLALLDAQGLGITDALYHQTLDGHGCCGHAHDHHHGHGHDHDNGHGHGHGHHHHDGHEHGCGCTGHSHDHLHHHTHEHHDHAPGSSCADQGQDDGHAHHGGCTAHDHGHAHHHAHDHHDHTHDDHAASWPVMTDEAVYVMEKMAHGFLRKGGTPGQGFYSLDDDDELELWSGLSRFVRRSLKLPADDARDRLRYITAVEVLQALASRAAGNATTIEMASAGTGLWADAAHGPVAFIRSQKADAFAARAAELAQAYGPRFALPDNWQKLLPA